MGRNNCFPARTATLGLETRSICEAKAACLKLLISFVVRRAVCGLTTKNYNKYFLSVIANLDRGGWSPKNFTRLLLAQQSDISRFPLDDEFEARWIENPIYAGACRWRALARFWRS